MSSMRLLLALVTEPKDAAYIRGVDATYICSLSPSPSWSTELGPLYPQFKYY